MVCMTVSPRDSLAALSNEELVRLCRENDDSAAAELIVRFAPTVRKKAESFKGSMYDDLAQEGFLALLDAVRRYVPERGAAFSTFALTCITNRMINAFRHSSDAYASLPEDLDQPDDAAVIPENIVVENESLGELFRKIEDTLSPLELKVFRCYISGLPYQIISQRLGISVKAVDNAVQRTRKKLREVLR